MGSPLEHRFDFIVASTDHNANGRPTSESVYACVSRRGIGPFEVQEQTLLPHVSVSSSQGEDAQ